MHRIRLIGGLHTFFQVAGTRAGCWWPAGFRRKRARAACIDELHLQWQGLSPSSSLPVVCNPIVTTALLLAVGLGAVLQALDGQVAADVRARRLGRDHAVPEVGVDAVGRAASESRARTLRVSAFMTSGYRCT